MPKAKMVQKQTGESAKSNLSSAAERFLAHALAHALDNDLRSPDEFLEAFPPEELMQALDADLDLRTEILVNAVGLPERIARKKTAESAAEDLVLALDEGVTNATGILELISPDDCVKVLDQPHLFEFAFDPESITSGGEAASARLMFALEAALAEDLIALVDIVEGVSFETIANSLGEAELRKIVENALRLGKSGEALTLDQLLAVVPLPELVKNLPPDAIWDRVVLAKVAEPAGFTRKRSISPRAKAAPPKAPSVEPPKSVRPKEPPPKPVRPAPVPPAISNGRSSVDSLPDVDEDGGEENARRRVIERLSAIRRLPPRHNELSIQILFEIDSMYADLFAASTDDAREEAIRDSFPNEQHMATALLALIELLEPSFDVNDPEIAKADVDSLINVFLIEERDQRERASGSQRPVPAPVAAGLVPPPPPPQKRSAPPPLPRGANPMPPPLPSLDKSR